MFKEHETCETPGQCGEELKMCQTAFVIRTETRYENDKPGKSALGYAVREAKCEHPEAEEAIKEAQTLLSEPADKP